MIKIAKKKTHEEFVAQLALISPMIEVIGHYENSDTRIKCKCRVCGHEWEAIPYNLLMGKSCAQCVYQRYKNERKKTQETFAMEVFEKYGNNIKIHGEYQNNHTKILCECTRHGTNFMITPQHLMAGESGCKFCIDEKSHQLLKSHAQFVEDLRNANDKITILGKYTGAFNRIKVKCNVCGHIWEPSAGSLICGSGCPNCHISKGEERVKEILNSSNIEFSQQIRYADLRGNGGLPLSYDFYLPKYNLLLEYQGKQHYKPVPIFGGEDTFLVQQEHDNRKREYAKSHGYNYLEISYQDFDNIENIINDTLHKIQSPVTTTAI